MSPNYKFLFFYEKSAKNIMKSIAFYSISSKFIVSYFPFFLVSLTFYIFNAYIIEGSISAEFVGSPLNLGPENITLFF